MKKIILIVMCLITLLIGIRILTISFNSKDNSGQFRTDSDPLKSRFPNIGEIKKSYWKADKYGRDFGPTSYWMKGYIYSDEGQIEKFRRSFKWKLTPEWKPEFDSKYSSSNEQQWAYSEGFDNFIKSSNFVGQFHMDLKNGVIYFYVQK